MIADLYEPDKRPAANGNFASGMYIGGTFEKNSDINLNRMASNAKRYLLRMRSYTQDT